MIAHAETENGFADYHADMNGDAFEHWFEEKLLPNLPEKCIL